MECYCPRCEQWLATDNFYRDKNGSTGLKTYCKQCQKSHAVKPEVLEQRRIRNRINRRNNPELKMVYSARNRSKTHNVPCTIAATDIHIPKYCPVLGIELVMSNKVTVATPSLDRIIPELGYVPGNICVISYRANRIKNDASLSEVIAVAQYIYEHTKDTELMDGSTVKNVKKKMVIKRNKNKEELTRLNR